MRKFVCIYVLTLLCFPADRWSFGQVQNAPYPVYRHGHNGAAGSGYYSRGSSNYGGGVFVNGNRYYETYVPTYRYNYWNGSPNLMILPGYVPGYGNFNQRY